MDEKDWIYTDDVDEEARWENVELLLSQVSADIEERDMLDAFLLAKAAGVPTNSLEKVKKRGQARKNYPPPIQIDSFSVGTLMIRLPGP